MSLPDIATGLYNALSGAAGVTAYVSTRIYNRQIPSGATETFPYLIFYDASSILRNWTGGQLHNTVWRVEARSRTSALHAQQIASAVHTALHGQIITVTGHANYRTTAERTNSFIENVSGGQTYRYVIDFRIRLDQN